MNNDKAEETAKAESLILWRNKKKASIARASSE